MDLSHEERTQNARAAYQQKPKLPAYVPRLIADILERYPNPRDVSRYLELGKANPFPGDKRFCAAWLAEIHRQEGRAA